MTTTPRPGHQPVSDPAAALPPTLHLVPRAAPPLPRPAPPLPFTSYPNQPPVGPAEALLREALERVLALAERWEETEPDAPHTVALWEALG
ncbi:hypothetical protein OG689_39050 [Kitasatospora sp. NBC_00240]|uniref:hypothetical protein n=1 Tax=Kitasatospora sp. NBC_00240 TaxID=2903567 RepID=UPI00225696B9|nr:hypothetical protein [Kitasatospora sp. NBC_00240]MCX5215193.1 hypothetical protein [Kitasatospora sp. NBC_00240]